MEDTADFFFRPLVRKSADMAVTRSKTAFDLRFSYRAVGIRP
jgi:hypothetical protein